MSRSKKIQPIYYSSLMGIEKNRAGYWGKHGVNDNEGWIGYAVVVGIFITSFFTVVLIG